MKYLVYTLSGSVRYARARSQKCIHIRNKQQQAEKNKSSCLMLALGDMDLPDPTTSSWPNRILNQSFKDWGGMKWLYAQNYYTEDAFWQMYDRK